MIDGEFVRAECRFPNGLTKQIKKDDRITVDNCVIKIQCNRKVSWQASVSSDQPKELKKKKVKKTAS